MPEAPVELDRDLKAQLESVLATYYERLQKARLIDDELKLCRRDRDAQKARADSQQDLIASIEQQLLASQAREADALERIGVLTGVMHAHGASIAEIVGRTASAVAPAPAEKPDVSDRPEEPK